MQRWIASAAIKFPSNKDDISNPQEVSALQLETASHFLSDPLQAVRPSTRKTHVTMKE